MKKLLASVIFLPILLSSCSQKMQHKNSFGRKIEKKEPIEIENSLETPPHFRQLNTDRASSSQNID